MCSIGSVFVEGPADDSAAAAGAGEPASESKGGDSKMGDDEDTSTAAAVNNPFTKAVMSGSGSTSAASWDRSYVPRTRRPPFQTLEFLVRDAPFSKKIMCSRDQMPSLVAEMSKYLDTVLSKTQYKDLKATRQQIASCFDKLTSFELPHPGHDITEDPDYDGNIAAIRKEFNFMMRYYVERVFNDSLVPKLICGRMVGTCALL